MLDLKKGIIGLNDDGETCHPYKCIEGDKAGFYSYTLSSNNKTFKPATKSKLREMIEAGDFQSGGRIRMIPLGTTRTGAGAMKVQSYTGRAVKT